MPTGFHADRYGERLFREAHLRPGRRAIAAVTEIPAWLLRHHITTALAGKDPSANGTESFPTRVRKPRRRVEQVVSDKQTAMPAWIARCATG